MAGRIWESGGLGWRVSESRANPCSKTANWRPGQASSDLGQVTTQLYKEREERLVDKSFKVLTLQVAERNRSKRLRLVGTT